MPAVPAWNCRGDGSRLRAECKPNCTSQHFVVLLTECAAIEYTSADNSPLYQCSMEDNHEISSFNDRHFAFELAEGGSDATGLSRGVSRLLLDSSSSNRMEDATGLSRGDSR